MTNIRQVPVQLARELLLLDPATGELTWRVTRGAARAGSAAGTTRGDGRKQVAMAGVLYLCHRVVWVIANGVNPIGDIDHINGDQADNRPVNLRDVPHLVNMQNRRRAQSGATSGRMGVTWDKRTSKWKTSIRVAGRCKHLGRFTDIDMAAEAYLIAKRALHAGCTI